MWRHQQSVDSQGIVDLDENCFSHCLYTPLVGIGVNVSFQLFLLMLRRFTDIPPHSCFIGALQTSADKSWGCSWR